MENDNINIQINLLDVQKYINSQDFQTYIMGTAPDMSIGVFILYVLNQTINYMMTDENIQT